MNHPAQQGWPIHLGLFLLSVATLTSEILLMRILSLLFFIIFVYIVIGIVMLSFSAAGTFLSIAPSMLRDHGERRLAFLALAFTVSTPVSYYLAVTPAPLVSGKSMFLLYLLFFSLIMTIHFFLAGLIIALLFTNRVREINRLYFINLVGSGVGCFVLIQSIRYLGAEGLILLVTLLGSVSFFCFCIAYSRKALAVLAVGLSVLVLCLFPSADRIFHLWPTLYGKQLSYIFKFGKDPKLEFQAWDPIARVDVASVADEYLYFPEKTPFKFATNDGSAGTFVIGFDKDFKDVNFTDWGTLGLPYWFKKNPEVLIIGLGGATDVMTALHYEAKKVYGVEISERMIEVVRDRFPDFTHHPYQHPNVEIIHDEGRSFVRRMKNKVDLIQMTGVDTVAAQAGGNFVMAENFLYTVEAFKEYFQHLNDHGILCITRFVINPDYPEKALRTCAMGVQALRELGVDHPEDHFIVVSYGIFLTTLMKKSPFTQEECGMFLQNLQQSRVDPALNPMPFMGNLVNLRLDEGRRVLYMPGEYEENQFGKYFKSLVKGEAEEFMENYPWNMRPCTDDRPFFFVAERWDNLFRKGTNLKDFPPVGFLFQVLLILWFGFLTLLLVLVPLYFFNKEGLKTRGSRNCILYFSGLGLGYMLIEIGFMQKFTLFLGHPTYSVSVVLFSLLCFSGVGSLASGRLWGLNLKRTVWASISCLMVLAVIYAFALTPIFQHGLTFPLGTRILISILLIAPLAFFMGMPFPTGLRIVEKESLRFVPWAWAINGSASVMAIFLAGLIAVFAGFTVVTACAVLIYLFSMVVMLRYKTTS